MTVIAYLTQYITVDINQYTQLDILTGISTIGIQKI